MELHVTQRKKVHETFGNLRSTVECEINYRAQITLTMLDFAPADLSWPFGRERKNPFFFIPSANSELVPSAGSGQALSEVEGTGYSLTFPVVVTTPKIPKRNDWCRIWDAPNIFN
jgi:hypothetical protein